MILNLNFFEGYKLPILAIFSLENHPICPFVNFRYDSVLVINTISGLFHWLFFLNLFHCRLKKL